MALWLEQRGFTLCLRPTDGPSQPVDERYVRLSVVIRQGLFSGWFNVREARAEPRRNGPPRPLGGGRMLSWRWLGEGEANALAHRRLQALESMGYELLEGELALRGPWDWLRELVERGITGDASAAADAPDHHGALRDALTRLGLGKDELIEGVAEVLEIHPVRFENPDPETIAGVDREQLATLLPYLLEHSDAAVRDIGSRWLDSPTTVFELPQQVVVGWLLEDGVAARRLAPRLRREGLALLGPDGLSRLARDAANPRVKDGARAWIQRMGAPV